MSPDDGPKMDTLLARLGTDRPDPTGSIGKQYGVTGVPETFVIDRDGKVARKFIGAVTERQLAASIEDILR